MQDPIIRTCLLRIAESVAKQIVRRGKFEEREFELDLKRELAEIQAIQDERTMRVADDCIKRILNKYPEPKPPDNDKDIGKHLMAVMRRQIAMEIITLIQTV